MARRRADLKCTCDDNGFCPKCASGKLEGSGECECPARKALEEITKIRCGCPNGQHGMHKLPCSIVLAEEALSAPCPCEEKLALIEGTFHGTAPAGTSPVDIKRGRAVITDAYIRDGKPPQKVNWMYGQAVVQFLRADAAEAERDSLRAELAAERERSANLEMARDIAQERADRIEAVAWNALKLARSLHDLALKSESKLTASQERERLLREALALAESWVVADGAHGRADRPDIDASRSSRRAKAIDQINEAFRLATPEGTVRP